MLLSYFQIPLLCSLPCPSAAPSTTRLSATSTSFERLKLLCAVGVPRFVNGSPIIGHYKPKFFWASNFAFAELLLWSAHWVEKYLQFVLTDPHVTEPLQVSDAIHYNHSTTTSLRVWKLDATFIVYNSAKYYSNRVLFLLNAILIDAAATSSHSRFFPLVVPIWSYNSHRLYSISLRMKVFEHFPVFPIGELALMLKTG